MPGEIILLIYRNHDLKCIFQLATRKQLSCYAADQNPIMVKNDTRCGPLTPFCASFLFLSESDPHGPSNSVLKWSKSKVVVGALLRSLMGTLCPRLLQVE